ncbi:uncharacterized protein [Amphiura filiformis]|uniref:uncharacterized protein n=1 Tax=Amphiura filiformis TaxID=82378 RepID=UPI003B2192EA
MSYCGGSIHIKLYTQVHELRTEDYLANRKGPIVGSTLTETTNKQGGLFGLETSTRFGLGGTNTTIAAGGGLFGSTNTRSSLLSTPTGTSNAFGSAFGGSASDSLFGQTSGTSTAFGQPVTSSLFGSQQTIPVVGTTVKFQPATGSDTMVKYNVCTTVNTRHMVITAMKEYEHKSFEELRTEDYIANRKGPTVSLIGGSTLMQTNNKHGELFGLQTSQAYVIGGLQSKVVGRSTGGTDRLGQEEAVRNVREEDWVTPKAAQCAVTAADATASKSAAAAGASKIIQGGASLNKFVSEDALKQYETVQKKLEETVHAYQSLKSSSDAEVKNFRTDIMKAVNTPINVISVQSARQLLDQLQRLSKLLAGERVEISGGRQVSIAALPSAKAYCLEALARKLVDQCDTEISVNHEAAFPYAAVTVALWQDYPELKELMLAHFYKGCPFLLPYYIAKEDTQSIEDYYKALGYVYDANGQ